MANAMLMLLVIGIALMVAIPMLVPSVAAWSVSLVILVVAVLAALKWAGLKAVSAFPVGKKGSMWVALIGILAFLFMGGYLSGLLGGIPAADLGGGGISASDCRASVNDNILGKAASLTMNAYDQESNTPYSATVDSLVYVFKNGQFAQSTDTVAARSLTTSLAVGDVVDIYGGNASYYVDPISICVDTEAVSAEIAAHALVSESEMSITGYDDTGTTALDSPSGTYSANQEDAELAMGADESAAIWLKLKVNAANNAYNLKGVATKSYEGTADTIDSVDLIGNDAGLSFSKVAVPKYLANTVISLNDTTTTSNTTDGYDQYWELPAAYMMNEWDTIKLEFEITSGGTGPSEDDDATPTAASMVFFQFVDAVWVRGDDGKMYESSYTKDSSEDNVGLVETLYSPLGGETGYALELA